MIRRFFAIFAVCAMVPAVSLGQTGIPPAVPVPMAGPAPLDGYLQRWEQEMLRVQTLVAQLRLIEKDKTFQAASTSIGVAKYMKVGSGAQAVNLALLELKKENKNEPDRRFICTGTYLYEMSFEQKVIRAFELPKPKPGQVADDNFLSFLFGMKAQDARARYDMKLVKEDQWYAYLDVLPRTPPDRADFQRARVVLNRTNFLPRQLWFEKSNGDEVTWDLPRLDPGAPVDRREFDPPSVPQGWRVLEEAVKPSVAAPPVQPRVVRPNP